MWVTILSSLLSTQWGKGMRSELGTAAVLALPQSSPEPQDSCSHSEFCSSFSSNFLLLFQDPLTYCLTFPFSFVSFYFAMGRISISLIKPLPAYCFYDCEGYPLNLSWICFPQDQKTISCILLRERCGERTPLFPSHPLWGRLHPGAGQRLLLFQTQEATEQTLSQFTEK